VGDVVDMAVDVVVDVAVVGAGLAGAATAWAAARRGASVAVFEQFEAGHARGSSHGSARIVRRAYGDALYTRLTGEAFELWREVELASGNTILRMLGGLDFGAARNVAEVASHLRDNGVAHEVLDAAEASRRWPGMRFDGPVVFHEQAGTMDAALAVSSMVSLAERAGAVVRYSTPVSGIAVRGDEHVTLRLADGAEVIARSVVVAAGAWVAELASGLAALPPIVVTQQQIAHFARLDPSAPPWPSVIHEGARPVYHLAGGRDGGPGDDRKVGLHDWGPAVTAAGRDGVIDPAGSAAVADYVREWLPGLDPTPRAETTCLYTSTPTEDFVLDRVGPVVVCSPCSGHGAKFAPLIGRLTAGLALDGRADVPERFRLDAHRIADRRAVSL
jgi:sarcosine oxidase